jgi:hypothetical protein
LTTRKKVSLLLLIIGVPAVFYTLDYVSVLLGVPSRPRFATFTVNRFYRVDEKFNKFSLNPLPAVDERCVNSLFPHFGSRPCWYVSRHTMESVEVN